MPEYDQRRHRATAVPGQRSEVEGPPVAHFLAAGNRAVTNALSVQRDSSATGLLADAAGVRSSGHSLVATAKIAGGAQLGPETDGKIIHTEQDTSVRAEVSDRGVSITFGPSLVITKVDAFWVFDVDIQLHRISLDFATQQPTVEWSAAAPVAWFGGVGDQLLAAIKGELGKLPARTREPGYNPFTDQELPGELLKLVDGVAKQVDGHQSQISDLSLQATLTVDNDVVREIESGVEIVVPAGTSLLAEVKFTGNLAKPQIARIDLTPSGRKLTTINVRALGEDWPAVTLLSASIERKGEIKVQYTTIAEEIGLVARELGGLLGVTSPAAGGQRGRSVPDEVIRAFVDKRIDDKVKPAVLEAIRSSSEANPGLRIAEMLGM